MTSRTPIIAALALLAAAAPACGDGGGGAGSDAGADTDADTDTDTDADTDTDTEADGGTPSVVTWVPIPAGSFRMGCSDGDAECNGNESPAHEVAVAAFEMTATEATQTQYFETTGLSPGDYYCPECAASKIGLDAAAAYCAAIGGRLPTEAEWEYAARAGTAGPYYFGDADGLDGAAWYQDNSEGHAMEVGQKEPNAFGLYDLIGNAIEWVEDCYHETYAGAPADGSAWVEDGCEYRVLRGGCYGSAPAALRVSWRDGVLPNFYGSCLPGVRCARSAGGDPDAGADAGE